MRRAIALACLTALVPCAAARAATPASGSVSSAAAQATWTGVVDGTGGPSAYAAAGGTNGFCRAPRCDTYTLRVDSEALRLELQTRTDRSADSMSMEIVRPDGSSEFVYDGTNIAAYVIDYPAVGEYTLHMIAGTVGTATEVGYSGAATLIERDRVAPDPSQPVSADHPRSSPEVGTPPPQPRRALTLRMRADSTRPATLARRGLRVRIRCSGGCETVRLRLVGARKTLGRAVLSGGVDGRAVAVLKVASRYRSWLRGRRSVKLKLTGVARAADGRGAATAVTLRLRR